MLHSALSLLESVAAFYRIVGPAGDPAGGAMLDRVNRILGDVTPAQPAVAPGSLPAADLLLPALERVAPTARPLASAIRDAAPGFHWRQNPNYSTANMGARFMGGYGYVEFAGPKEALFHAEAIRVGILLLGPGLHYPAHAHPAEEIYHPLTEGGEWRRGSEPWRRVPACAAIHHPPMLTHETRAGTGTLLALYCWCGDTATEARLI